MPKKILCFWQRAELLEEERGLTYWCISVILSLYFFFLISNFPFLFLFLFFSQYLFPCCDFLLEVTITLIMIPSLLCTASVLYIMSAVTNFYYMSLELPLSDLDVLADCHQFVSHSASTTYLCQLCHSPSPDKEGYFVRLFAVAFLPAIVWVLSLSLSLSPSWHAHSGSNSFLFLLDGMSSQQDIFPKKTKAGTPEQLFPSSHRQTISSYL